MEKILQIKNSLCTGCGVCKNICPVHAIRMDLQDGFLKPQVNMAECIHCNKCDDRCPIIQKEELRIPQCYAAWADNETRFESSSGGAFAVLAREVIKRGGVVFGTAWTDDFYVRHKYVDCLEDLPQLYRSKYVQSDIGDCYYQAGEFLKAGREVLFVGTPCQIAGLESYLSGENTEKLIKVDFICYYNPPISVLRRYLDDNYGLENLKKFTFRDKTNGWISHATEIEMKDDSRIIEKNVTSYFQGYFKGLYARDACNSCTFSGAEHHSDITLGDFWKIEEHDPSWNDGRGTSMLIAHTLKGREYIQKTKNKFQRIQRTPFSWIRQGQTNCKKHHPGRDYFYELLQTKSFDRAVDMALTGKHDIGMVCVQSYKNFGSAFTNFALYHVLKDMNYSVFIITQPLSSEIKPENTDNFLHSPYKDYENAKHYASIPDMKELNSKCEKFVVGSDQLFNYEIYKRIDGFVKLDWVDDEHKKICYATSFGVDRILGTFEESVNLKRSLTRFDAVSLRESSGVELVKKNFGIHATRVLDPVFLCKREHYVQLCEGAGDYTNRIFAYMLDPTREKQEAIQYLEQHFGKDAIIFADRWMNEAYLAEKWELKCELGKKNEEWLKALMDSEFVITDSFHGMCMAIIFGKQFVVINNKNRGTARFVSLLELLGLGDRMIDEPAAISQAIQKEKIDYTAVYQKLEGEKKNGMDWLKNHLN